MADLLERLKAALADRYRIERELGSGGMVTVYLALDIRHERNVAVKVLRPKLSASLFNDRFLREVEITANLNHPHIPPCATRVKLAVCSTTSCPASMVDFGPASPAWHSREPARQWTRRVCAEGGRRSNRSGS
jgi:hypothetical protein